MKLLGIEITKEQFDYFMCQQSQGKELKIVNDEIVALDHEATEEEQKQQALSIKISRMEELRKDFEQDRLGLVVPDLEEKKQEYISLLQEVRALQGKPEREMVADKNNILTNNE